MQDLSQLQDLINVHENRVTNEACTAAIAFFETLLSPNFGFQKRDPNKVVNKTEFIEELNKPSQIQRTIKSETIIVSNVAQNVAWVELTIAFTEKDVAYETRNHRLFTKVDDVWQLTAWINKKIS
jgi:hypothetical protein